MEENKLTPQQDKNISVLNSKVEWIKLGEVIRQCDERNTKNLKYPVVGINKDKCFIPNKRRNSQNMRAHTHEAQHVDDTNGQGNEANS